MTAKFPVYEYSDDHIELWRNIEEILTPTQPEAVRQKIEAEVNFYLRSKTSKLHQQRPSHVRQGYADVREAAEKLEKTMAAVENWDLGPFYKRPIDYRQAPTEITLIIDNWLSVVPKDKGGKLGDLSLEFLVTRLADIYRGLGHEPVASGDFLALVDACRSLAGADASDTRDPKTVERILKGKTSYGFAKRSIGTQPQPK